MSDQSLSLTEIFPLDRPFPSSTEQPEDARDLLKVFLL